MRLITSWRRGRAFAATVVLTLGLGIGLATAVFTVAHAVLLRPLPVRDEARVVVLSGASPSDVNALPDAPLGLTSGLDFVRETRALRPAALSAYEGAYPQLMLDEKRGGDRGVTLKRALVSGAFFDALGVRPLLGRTLRVDDDAWGAPPVAVISYNAWRRDFGGDPRVVGRRITRYWDGVASTIVGVMPPGLDYPRGAELWAPILASTPPFAVRYSAVFVVGRLAPQATARDARAELTAFYAKPGVAPLGKSLRGVARSLPQVVVGDTRPALVAFAGAAIVLLLITCLDVANLLLVRGLARTRELAVRSALGASRWQMLRALLAEHAALALAGGVLGVVVAAVAVRAFVAFAPTDVPRLDEVHMSGAAFGAAFAITALAMLLFGLAPAVVQSRAEAQGALRGGARAGATPRSRLVAETLVAAQVALALVVLSAATLVARSLVALERAPLAFDPSRVLVAELAARLDRYDDVAKQRAMLDQVTARVAALPGVRGVSPAVAPPFSGTAGWDGQLTTDGQTSEQQATNPVVNLELVAPSYFDAMRVALQRGRTFTDADREGAPHVIVISESTARAYWPNESPLGKQLSLSRGEKFTVIGVVADTRYRDLREARPSVYFPLAQSPFPASALNLVIGTRVDPASLVPAIRRAVGDAAPGVTVASAAPFETYLDAPLARPRLHTLLLGVFATAAFALAAIGLFGVVAATVRQRRRELGVRLALGATGADLARMIVRRGLAIAGAGWIAGLVGALAANGLLGALLYGVRPTDPLTLAAVSALLLVVALAASFFPARASARVDPVRTLRDE